MIETPTTQEINDNLIAQLQATLAQTIPLLPRSFIRVLARALSGVFILVYKYSAWASLQQFVRTAQYADTTINGVTVNPLIEWGRLIGVGDPTAATQAELLITVTVENQTGSLPSGSQLVGPDNGVTYITLSAVALNAATVQVTVRAAADQTGGDGSGTVGNLDPGDILSFANPLANVARDAVVDSQTVTGADAEAVEVYRQRIVDRFQKLPQGGAYADYEQWGESVAGILNVYPYTSPNPGQVDLYIEATVASSGSPDGIPTPAQLQAVLDAVNLPTRRPVGALVNAFEITRTSFEVTVGGLSAPDLIQTQTDIETALDDYFAAREPYIEGLSIPPRTDRITATAAGGVVDDIVSAAGGFFESLLLRVDGSLITSYTLGIGEKAKTTVVFS